MSLRVSLTAALWITLTLAQQAPLKATNLFTKNLTDFAGKEVTLVMSDVLHESPDDIHTVGRKACATTPAKFIAFIAKKKGAPISIPVYDLR